MGAVSRTRVSLTTLIIGGCTIHSQTDAVRVERKFPPTYTLLFRLAFQKSAKGHWLVTNHRWYILFCNNYITWCILVIMLWQPLKTTGNTTSKRENSLRGTRIWGRYRLNQDISTTGLYWNTRPSSLSSITRSHSMICLKSSYHRRLNPCFWNFDRQDIRVDAVRQAVVQAST